MRLLGFFLLLAGWLLVLAAIVLMHATGFLGAFMLAGVGVECLGLFNIVRSHLAHRGHRT